MTGKSRLCVDAVQRGHKLIADDAVELQNKAGRLFGSVPASIRGLLEIRGIGIVDVRDRFGVASFTDSCEIRSCVRLFNGDLVSELDGADERGSTICFEGVTLPCVGISGRLANVWLLGSIAQKFEKARAAGG